MNAIAIQQQGGAVAAISPALAALRAKLGGAAPNWADKLSQGASVPRISLKGNRFSVEIAGQTVRSLDTLYADVIIVGGMGSIGRQYYAEAYDPDKPAAPSCWSTNGATPDADVTDRQATACAACPMDQKGSAKNGSSKACGYLTKIAVVLTDSAEAYSQPLLIDVKAMSIFGDSFPNDRKYNFQKYLQTLAAMGLQPHEVVTRLQFNPNQSVPSLLFQPVNTLQEGHIDLLMPYFDQRKTEVENLVRMRVGGVSQAPAALPHAAPVQQVAPLVQAAPPPVAPVVQAAPPPAVPPADAAFQPAGFVQRDFAGAAPTTTSRPPAPAAAPPPVAPVQVAPANASPTPMSNDIEAFLADIAK